VAHSRGRSRQSVGSLVAPIATSLVLLHLPAAAAAPASSGASSPRTDGRLTESTSVTLVEVPVQVVRNGEPVRGLKASDFEIVEGRQTRPITGFDVVDLAAPENRLLSADIPAAGKRHFLLLFDLANSKPKTIARAQVGPLVPGSGGRPDVYNAFFRLPTKLAPGSYRLVVTGTGPGGTLSAAAPFAVAGGGAAR
jgi:hypothetical protein